MTYFDLKTLIESNLHGGHLQADAWESAMKRAGFKCPLYVSCIRYGTDAEPRFANALLTINCHPGLLYTLSKEPLAESTPTQIVATYDCKHPSDILNQLRAAVIDQRRQLIRQLDLDPSYVPSWHEEIQARNEFMHSIQQQSPWQSLFEQWWNTILLRHQQMLLELRRKVCDCASLLSTDIDMHWHFPIAPSTQYAQIHQCFDYLALRDHSLALFKNIAQGFIRQAEQFNPERHAQQIDNPIVQSAYHYATEHYQEDISLQDAADYVHVSAAHLARLFKKELGVTYVHLLQGLRLQHARERLQTSNDSVLSIALDSGFQSVKHFHRVFLKWVQLTPQQYRKHHHQI